MTSVQKRSHIIVFVLAVLVWWALTDIRDLQEVITGIVVAVLVSLIAGHFLITTPERQRSLLHRSLMSIRYAFKFLYEMTKANVHVAYLVVHPGLPIKPGIVKIRTGLKRESALTLLSNSITLTPGTLTVDVLPDKQVLYIHVIDIPSTDVEENTRKIGYKFEHLLKEIFE